MSLKELRTVERIRVFKDSVLVGHLSRTTQGARFSFDETFRTESLRRENYGLSFTLGPSEKVHEISGVNLHPFFAGLLPEGLRLKALRLAIKTSEDDLFSMLLALGSNCIGDVYVRSQEQDNEPEVNQENLSEVSFYELFKKSISAEDLHTRELDSGIPGVMPKLSASMISFPVKISKRTKQYLLKLATAEHPQLVENEHFFMQMAKRCGFSVPETKLVFDKNGVSGLLVDRFDRIYNQEKKTFRKLHQEDACQFLGRYPQDKYRISLRQIAEGIEIFSGSPAIDISKMINLYVFSYLIGNGDLHGKNISLLEDSESRIRLSPAYDLLTTLPYGDRKMALELNGKNDNFYLKDLVQFGRIFKLPERQIQASTKRILDSIEPWISRFGEIGLAAKKSADLKKTCADRAKRLKAGITM